MAEQSHPELRGRPVENSHIDDPYAGNHQRGVPSNPAWRFCPEFARTPSPKSKPGVWPPKPLRWPSMSIGDGFFPFLGMVARVPTPVMNQFMAQGPLPSRPHDCHYGQDHGGDDKFTTPPRRKVVNSPRMLLSPSSGDTSSGKNSGVSLGKSGYKADSSTNVTEGLPFITPEPSIGSSSESEKLLDVLSSQDSDKSNREMMTPDGKAMISKGVKRKRARHEGSQNDHQRDADASKSPAHSQTIHIVASSSASASSFARAPIVAPDKIDVKCEMSVTLESNQKKMRRER